MIHKSSILSSIRKYKNWKSTLLVFLLLGTTSIYALSEYQAGSIVAVILEEYRLLNTQEAKDAYLTNLRIQLDLADGDLRTIRTSLDTPNLVATDPDGRGNKPFIFLEGASLNVKTAYKDDRLKFYYVGDPQYTSYTVYTKLNFSDGRTDTKTFPNLTATVGERHLLETSLQEGGLTIPGEGAEVYIVGCKANGCDAVADRSPNTINVTVGTLNTTAQVGRTASDGNIVNVTSGGFGSSRCYDKTAIELSQGNSILYTNRAQDGSDSIPYLKPNIISDLSIANDPTLSGSPHDFWYCVKGDARAGTPFLYSPSQTRTCWPKHVIADTNCYNGVGNPASDTTGIVASTAQITLGETLNGVTYANYLTQVDARIKDAFEPGRHVLCSTDISQHPAETACGGTNDTLNAREYRLFARKGKCDVSLIYFQFYKNNYSNTQGRAGEFVCVQNGYMTFKGNVVNYRNIDLSESLTAGPTCGTIKTTFTSPGLSYGMNSMFWTTGSSKVPDTNVIQMMDRSFCEQFKRQGTFQKFVQAFGGLSGYNFGFTDQADFCTQATGTCHNDLGPEHVLNSITSAICANPNDIAAATLYCTNFEGSLVESCINAIANQLIAICPNMDNKNTTLKMCYGDNYNHRDINFDTVTNTTNTAGVHQNLQKGYCGTASAGRNPVYTYIPVRGSASHATDTVRYKRTINLEFINDNNSLSSKPFNLNRTDMEVCYPEPNRSGVFLDFGNTKPVYSSTHCRESDSQYRAIRDGGCDRESMVYIKYQNDATKGEFLCEGSPRITRGDTLMSLQNFYAAPEFPKTITPSASLKNILGTTQLVCWNKQGMIDGSTNGSNDGLISRMTYASTYAGTTTADWWYCVDDSRTKGYLWDNTRQRTCMVNDNDNCYKAAPEFPKIITPSASLKSTLGTTQLVCWNKQGMIDGSTNGSNDGLVSRMTYASTYAGSTTTDWWYCVDDSRTKGYLWDNTRQRTCLVDNNDNCYRGL